ncbi:MAG TPA: isoprenylcysteine carboxylmethyltransferase family protein [Acidobacteriota bacterium]
MLYLSFLVLNALEMVWEVRVSSRNSAGLLQRGAVEVAPALLPIMAVMYMAMYIGSGWEYIHWPRHISAPWALSFLSLFVLAKLLKLWAVSHLGRNWTMRVLIVPDSRVVVSGPYKWMKHPNYAAVLLEIAATTLLGRCYWTFTTVSSAFIVALFFRIRAEESALLSYADYADQMNHKKRFLP